MVGCDSERLGEPRVALFACGGSDDARHARAQPRQGLREKLCVQIRTYQPGLRGERLRPLRPSDAHALWAGMDSSIDVAHACMR
jgi:hypothetical protein